MSRKKTNLSVSGSESGAEMVVNGEFQSHKMGAALVGEIRTPAGNCSLPHDQPSSLRDKLCVSPL